MRRGSKPKGKVSIVWSTEFAYAIGLITADGCLSKDRRHIDFTSKDKDLVLLFRKCLGITTKVSKKYSGAGNLCYHTQFGDVLFYGFLEKIGLSAAKSKTLSSLHIPDKYFIDFLRGYFDGDGTSYSYYDPVFKKSFRFYISFASASPAFFVWLRAKMENNIGIEGSVIQRKGVPHVQLRYAKKATIMLCERMYEKNNAPHLRRKRLKILKSMRIIEASKAR